MFGHIKRIGVFSASALMLFLFATHGGFGVAKIYDSVKNAGGSTYQVSSVGKIEVAFSPNEGAEGLVVKVIDAAKSDISMLTYSFTSAPVTDALRNAVKRGVKVRIVSDYKNNTVQDKSGKARAALSSLSNLGADVKLIKVYQIHHDKVIIVDGETVELGSFNYSASAQNRNSENVFVNWGNPGLASVYMSHFDRNYKQAIKFETQY